MDTFTKLAIEQSAASDVLMQAAIERQSCAIEAYGYAVEAYERAREAYQRAILAFIVAEHAAQDVVRRRTTQQFAASD